MIKALLLCFLLVLSSSLLASCSNTDMTGSRRGACCTAERQLALNETSPCSENVAASKCLGQLKGLYLGDDTRCDRKKIDLCSHLPGACCSAARSQCIERSNFATCGAARFAGFGTTCANSCANSPHTTLHTTHAATTTTTTTTTISNGTPEDVSYEHGEGPLRLVVRGRLYDHHNRSTVVSHAVIALMSRDYVKLASTRTDKHGEYAIEVPESRFASLVSEAHAPMRIVASNEGLHAADRSRCYRSKRHKPRTVAVDQVPAVRNVPVSCDSLAPNATTATRDASMRKSFATLQSNKLSSSSILFIVLLLASCAVLWACLFFSC